MLYDYKTYVNSIILLLTLILAPSKLKIDEVFTTTAQEFLFLINTNLFKDLVQFILLNQELLT